MELEERVANTFNAFFGANSIFIICFQSKCHKIRKYDILVLTEFFMSFLRLEDLVTMGGSGILWKRKMKGEKIGSPMSHRDFLYVRTATKNK